MNLFTLLISGIIVNNFILTKFLGLCPFLGVSDDERGTIGISISLTIVMVLTNIITYFLYNYVLIPLNIEYLRTIIFILVIASLVQLIEMVINHYFPKLHQLLGIYLPLLTTNCAILGAALLSSNNNYSLIETIVFSIGSSLGYFIVIYLFANIRERTQHSPIPVAFKGIPIALITASIMSLLFMRYVG
ncbi:MAG: electron transport complex protein RnfA [Bacilli bacterium]|jgi:electron transport complex protein RnfA